MLTEASFALKNLITPPTCLLFEMVHHRVFLLAICAYLSLFIHLRILNISLYHRVISPSVLLKPCISVKVIMAGFFLVSEKFFLVPDLKLTDVAIDTWVLLDYMEEELRMVEERICFKIILENADIAFEFLEVIVANILDVFVVCALLSQQTLWFLIIL